MARCKAATALDRLLCEQGTRREARDLVGSAYTALNEGLQTTDLVEARALLAQT